MGKFVMFNDERTECRGIRHLIGYARYLEDTAVNDDTLFCKYTKGRTTARNSFKVIDDSVKENTKRRDCFAVHMGAGNREV
jgi:hypothetical protein